MTFVLAIPPLWPWLNWRTKSPKRLLIYFYADFLWLTEGIRYRGQRNVNEYVRTLWLTWNISECFSNHISNRRLLVLSSGFKSQLRTVQCGVHKGSILGLRLSHVLIYISDICNTPILLQFTPFADDTNALALGKSLKVLLWKLNHELETVSEWHSANGL